MWLFVSRILRSILCASGLALLLAAARPANAQLLQQFPQSSGVDDLGPLPATPPPGFSFGPASGGSSPSLPPAVFGTPMLEPYGTSPAPLAPAWPGGFGAPALAPGGAGLGTGLPPGPLGSGQAPYPPSFPPSLFPNRWFPNGLGGLFRGQPAAPASGVEGPAAGARPLRLIYGPRFRYTFLPDGDRPRDLDIQDFDFSIVAAWPNFLFSTQPLFIVPSFSLHLWDGPQFGPADLPSKAYSAFLDFGWDSDPSRQFGAELGVRVGVFSDFETYTENSIRILGKALGRVRFSPTLSAKAGVFYIDRNELKLIPAGGLFWEPNPQTRLELFFPYPKFTRYLTSVGNQEVWWHVGAEYGGGSWTVKRIARPPAIPAAYSDQVDLNDIRLFTGVEFGPESWMRSGRRLGFIEVGWVLERRIRYRIRPEDNLRLNDTVMLRLGVGY